MTSGRRVKSAQAAVITAAMLCGSPTVTHVRAQNGERYPNPYRTIESPLRVPQGRQLGSVFGLDVDHHGDIWVLDTCGGTMQACTASKLDPIMKFDKSGTFLKSFGGGMIVHPHGLYADPSGNIWVADGVGGEETQPTRGFQVFKFNPEGQLLLTLGTAGVKGETDTTFNMPTDVVVAPNGNIFVADGGSTEGTNGRIVKFTKDGKFISAWGTRGTGPGQFSEPHSVAMDSRGRLFVGDRRDNARIQIFDQDGKFLDQWKQFGVPSEIFIDRHDVMYVTTNVSKDVLTRGIYVGSAKDGRVTAFIPEADSTQELVVADTDGNIWSGFLSRKILKHVKQ